MVKNVHDQRNFHPYELPGRWYKFFIESDGSAQTLTTSDIDGAVISSNAIKLPEGWRCVEMAHDIHFDSSSASTFVPGVKYYANGQQAAVIPPAAAFDYADIYVYAYKEQTE